MYRATRPKHVLRDLLKAVKGEKCVLFLLFSVAAQKQRVGKTGNAFRSAAFPLSSRSLAKRKVIHFQLASESFESSFSGGKGSGKFFLIEQEEAKF